MRCLRQLRLSVLCAGLRILRDKANADKARVESAYFVGAGEEGLERLIHRFRSGSELFAAGIVFARKLTCRFQVGPGLSRKHFTRGGPIGLCRIALRTC